MITSGRDETPVAKFEAIHPVGEETLETPGFVLTEAFFESLPDES